jgi:molecular chaperone GrpE (heat shock protein)
MTCRVDTSNIFIIRKRYIETKQRCVTNKRKSIFDEESNQYIIVEAEREEFRNIRLNDKEEIKKYMYKILSRFFLLHISKRKKDEL